MGGDTTWGRSTRLRAVCLAERAEVVLLDGPDRKLVAADESVKSGRREKETGPAHNLGRIDTGADNLEPDLGALLDRELFQEEGRGGERWRFVEEGSRRSADEASTGRRNSPTHRVFRAREARRVRVGIKAKVWRDQLRAFSDSFESAIPALVRSPARPG